MKKLIVSAALSSSLFAFDLGSILGSYNPLDQISSVGGVEAFGMCYKRNQFTVDICSMIPDLGSAGLDGCSMLPNIPGFSKRSSNLDFDANSYLKNYCQPTAKKVNSVIADVDIYASDVINGKKTYPGGDTPTKFYNNAVDNILSKSSLAKTNFTNNNQTVTKEILTVGKVKGTQDLTSLTTKDLEAGVPKNYDEYLEQRDAVAKLTVSDVTTNTPTQVSNALNSKIKNKEGAAARTVAENYVQDATDLINANTDKRIGFEIDLQRKDTDLAIPTLDTINMYRDDIKPQKIAELKDQLRREAKIKADIITQDKMRADIVALIGQKAVIVNEKFDRAAARNEIEALLK